MKKRCVFALVYVFTGLLLISCSAKKDNMSYEMSTNSKTSNATSSSNYDNQSENKLKMDSVIEPETTGLTDSVNDSGINISTQDVSTNRKLIKEVSLELQTLEFTNTLNIIMAEVKAEGGYVENSNIQGNAIHENDTRSARLVIRIPSNITDSFINLLDEKTNIINRNEETKDITRAFVDTQNRIKMLQIEQERLLSFLEKAQNLKDMITLEDRLGEVRYELEEYASTLKTYENLVEYSTITISISEVKEFVIKTEKQSALTRMNSGLNVTITNIRDGFVNFFVWLVVKLPYFIIWGLVIGGLTVIGLKINKKYKSKLYGATNKSVKQNSNSNEDDNDSVKSGK